jgi:membrane protein YdbS with pleckstrin-like domain
VSNQIVWQGKPTQILNLKTYVICFVWIVLVAIWSGEIAAFFNKMRLGGIYVYVKIGLFVFPLGTMLWRWLEVKLHDYEITSQVFRERYGILNRITQEVELYRVVDTTTVKPLELNVFGYGTIVMHTADQSSPIQIIAGIKDADKVREMIRDRVEILRREKGILEFANQ